MARYSQAASGVNTGQSIVNEFKTMVKMCHQRGIEVILDVVFNHTAEGNEQGPTISFRSVSSEKSGSTSHSNSRCSMPVCFENAI